jgi:hypothetical protein
VGGQIAGGSAERLLKAPDAFAMSQDLHTCFERHFTPEVALSPSQFEDVFRLRYQVYCLEKGFEDAARFPDGCERDRYDGHFV